MEFYLVLAKLSGCTIQINTLKSLFDLLYLKYQCNILFVTPMDTIDEEPQLSEILFDSNPEDLMVRHSGYDIRAALKDPNVSFPYQRMVSLKDQGVFAELTSNAYSFVGACSQIRLLKKTLPGWVDKFVDLGIDAVVLVPV